MKKLKFAKSMPTSIATALLAVAVAAVSIFAAVNFIPAGDNDDENTNRDYITSTGVPVYVPEKRTYMRPEETYEGVQGIILRSAASSVNASTISGTQVTDYMITADSTNPASAIAALESAGINAWISVPLTGVDSSMVSSVTDIIAANDVYGIELDFCGMPSNPGEANSDIDSINDFMATVRGVVNHYGALYGHDIKLSAKVYCDINTNYSFGIDVAAWVADDLVDMVTPSSGSEFANTDMSIRLWASLLDPYGVVLAPHIGGTIKNYESSTSTTAQTTQTLAGEAAFALAQGADKISVSTYVDKSMLNIIGSYDTVMTADRVHHISYNSMRKPWIPAHSQIPRTFNSSTNAIRIPMGNVPDNATVKVRITYNTTFFTNTNSDYANSNPTDYPSVKAYVNSQECTYNGYINGTVLQKTEKVWDWNKFKYVDVTVTVGYYATTYDYTVPASALDAGYAVFELIPQVTTKDGYTLTGVQLLVDVP